VLGCSKVGRATCSDGSSDMAPQRRRLPWLSLDGRLASRVYMQAFHGVGRGLHGVPITGAMFGPKVR